MNRQERRHAQPKKSNWKSWLIVILIILAIVAFVVYKNTKGTGVDYAQYSYSDDKYAAPNASVIIEEYSDFECPYCQQLAPTMRAVRETYSGKMRFVYKEYPLRTVHPFAQGAAEAAECARVQNRFWAYHDVLFESKMLTQRELKLHAQGLGLDMTKWNTCMDSGASKTIISQTLIEGQQKNVQGTPSIFVNGKVFSGRSVKDFADVIAQN